MLRWLLRIAVGLVAVALLIVAVVYLTADTPTVPKTVKDDPALPAIEVNGVRLHAETFGPLDHRPLIVIHGGPGNDYRALLPLRALADAYRVIFYDQRGSGLSERVDPKAMTLDAFVEELHGVRTHFAGEQEVALLGHSWGAMLATAYLARHPAGVRAAVLGEPGFLTPETGNQFLERTHHMRPPITWQAVRSLARAWGESLHVDGPDPQAAKDHFLLRLASTPLEGHPIGGYFCGGDLANAAFEQWRPGAEVGSNMFASALDEAGKVTINLSAGIDRYEGPVLLLAGSCNRIIGADVQQQHQRLFKNARLEVIEGVGHTMFGEKPELTQTIVRRFLGEVWPSATATASAAVR